LRVASPRSSTSPSRSADAPPRHRAIFTARTAAVEKLRPALALRSLEEIEFVELIERCRRMVKRP